MAPLVNPRGLGEVVLRVRDMPRALAFYRDLTSAEKERPDIGEGAHDNQSS